MSFFLTYRAIALFEQIERGNLEGYIAATTITNIFYIIRKTEGCEVALAAIHRLLTGLRFCAVDRQTVETALGLGLKDFEDSIQLACATIDRLDGIVTRDRKDFYRGNYCTANAVQYSISLSRICQSQFSQLDSYFDRSIT